MQFLKFMDDVNKSRYPQANTIRDTLSLLVKVSGTNKVQFAYGINILLGSPLETERALEGHFLAFHDYIDDTSKQTWVIFIPKDALKIQGVYIPSIEAFDAKLKLKKYSTKTWVATKTTTTIMGLAKLHPLPAFLAYDYFNEDIPAYIIYERIQYIYE